ncbi:MAG: hypothetical protein ACO3EK_19200, partial [Alphaproteobacteria bacterium]
MSAPPRPEDYPRHSQDKLRYGDTDRLGHVNNAAFSTFLETGRVEEAFWPPYFVMLAELTMASHFALAIAAKPELADYLDKKA